MYRIEVKPKAVKDLKSISKSEARKIIDGVLNLEKGLKGDIKRLTKFTPEYRMRIGNYRVLFEVADKKIVIYRIKHRKEVYR